MTQANSNRRAAVALARCGGYEVAEVRRALEEALSHLGGLGAFVRPGMRVLLKPNLVKGAPAARAVNTHPVFVEAVARMTMDLGARPTIGDSLSIFSARTAAAVCGLDKVADRLGIEIIDLDKPVAVPSRLGKRAPTLQLSSVALGFDAILNLPKLKCHEQLYMSAATKNLFGIVPKQRKFLLHYWIGAEPELFARMLVDVAAHAAPALTLVDSIVALERGGPIHGDPRLVGLVLAGTDCPAIDRVAVEIVGADPARLLTLGAARQMGWGTPDLEAIDVLGIPLEDAKVPGFVRTAVARPIAYRASQIPSFLVRNLYRRFIKRAGAG
ncbi:MAG: DUF362 domain-containing protein [Candidatus Sumerlaeota bacterium]|nr:DUF362 domain-containing protein [Candidatus Sumerlaeota bacterium]